MTDDVEVWNISAYHRGMIGGRTPNIDRIANERALFTDYYAQQSCTAGRSAFITGQHPFRTGLLAVGLPGSPLGLQKEDPTMLAFYLRCAVVLEGHAHSQLRGERDANRGSRSEEVAQRSRRNQ
jgi:arylsulfatase A-like enzyme